MMSRQGYDKDERVKSRMADVDQGCVEWDVGDEGS